MSAIHTNRVERLRRLEQFLPRGAAPDLCPDGARLLEVMGDAYTAGKESARRRALQHDLKELVATGRIEPVNSGGKPLRYRHVADDPRDDPAIWRYTLALIGDLVAEAVPRRQLERLWHRPLTGVEGPVLDETRLRILPDTLRLYALHRMIRAEASMETPAREMAGFNLDRAIAEGLADFGPGELVALELRVRGYLATVILAARSAEGIECAHGRRLTYSRSTQ